MTPPLTLQERLARPIGGPARVPVDDQRLLHRLRAAQRIWVTTRSRNALGEIDRLLDVWNRRRGR